MACQCQKEIADLKDFIKRWFVLISRRFDDQEKNFFDQNKKLNEIHSYVFQLIENQQTEKSSAFEFDEEEAPDNEITNPDVSMYENQTLDYAQPHVNSTFVNNEMINIENIKVESADFRSAIRVVESADSSDNEISVPVLSGFHGNRSATFRNNDLMSENQLIAESLDYLTNAATNSSIGAQEIHGANSILSHLLGQSQTFSYDSPTTSKSSIKSSHPGQNFAKKILSRSLTSSRRKILTKNNVTPKSVNLRLPNVSSCHSQPTTSSAIMKEVASPDECNIVDSWGDLLTFKKSKVVNLLMKNGSGFNYRFFHVTNLLPRKCGGYASIDKFVDKLAGYGFGTVERIGHVMSHWMFYKKRFDEMTPEGKRNFLKLNINQDAYDESFAHGLVKGSYR